MSARDDVLSTMAYAEEWYGGEKPHDELIREELDAYRTEVLREAHDAIRRDIAGLPEAPPWSAVMSYQQGMEWAARIVDRMAETFGPIQHL